MIRQVFRKAWYSFFRSHPLAYLVRPVLSVIPESYKLRLQGQFFLSEEPLGSLAYVIHLELEREFYSKSSDEIARLNREMFWGSAVGKKWHESKQILYSDPRRSEESYLKPRANLISQMDELFSSHPAFHTLCEIGTGNGIFLDHLSKRFPDLKRFVGIDLNKEQVEENRAAYSESRLEFVHSEISDWVHTELEAGTLFVTNGTLEYFTLVELRELLRLIQKKVNPAAIAVCEPLNLDLNSDVVSIPRAHTAYSHNYPRILKQFGYDIFRQSVDPIDPSVPFYDQVSLIAISRKAEDLRS